MIIYNTNNGLPLYLIGSSQEPSVFISSRQRDDLSWTVNKKGGDWFKYRIVNNSQEFVSDLEIFELNEYGRILSEEERNSNEKLENLKPTYEEIKKAENTIEILSLLSEVL